MALEQSDMEDLTRAIRDGISAGFRAHFENGRPGQNLNRTSVSTETNLPPPPPPPESSESLSTTVDLSFTAGSGVGAEQGTVFSTIENVGNALIQANKVVFDNAYDNQNNRMSVLFRGMVQTYGAGLKDISSEAFNTNDFAKISNTYAKNQLEIFGGLRNEYFKEGSELFQIVEGDFADLNAEFEDFSRKLSNTNIQAMKKINADSMKDVIKFSKATGIEAEGVAELVNLQFVKTGETSTKILDNLVNHAQKIGNQVGITMQDLLDDTTQIITNVGFFTKIGEGGATRLAASLRQVGLSIPSFESMTGAFRTFEGASNIMNELSAGFNIQLDSVEMMALANEDPEEFQRRIREVITSQAGDFESMSGTQQRLLANTLKLPMAEMKTFMNTNLQMTDRATMQGESAKADAMTQSETADVMAQSTIKYAKSAEELATAVKDQRFLSIAPQINKHAESVAGYGSAIQGVLSNTSAFGKVLEEMSVGSFEVYTTAAETAVEGQLSVVSAGVKAGEELLNSLADNIKSGADTVEGAMEALREAIAAMFSPNSMPNIYMPVKEGTEFMIGYLEKDASPRIANGLTGGYEGLGESTTEHTGARSLPKFARDLGPGLEEVHRTIEAASDEIGNMYLSPGGAKVPAVEIPKAATTAEMIQKLLTEELNMQISETELSASERLLGATSGIDLESLKTAIVSAISTGLENADQTSNITLEIDKKKLAEVMMTAKTSDRKSFAYIVT